MKAGCEPAVVILHYGSAATTRRLHEQLLAGDPAFAQRVFVLDNHAPEVYPGAWLRTDANLFWAGAFELAARLTAEMGASHLWFMNNDILFLTKPPHLGRAFARLAKLEGFLGMIGLYSPAVDKNPYHPQMVADPSLQYRTVRLADGVAPLMNLAALKEIGGLDCADNPRGYGVDLALSWRLRQAGWNIVVDHQAIIRHRYHSSARATEGFLEQAARDEEAYLRKRLGPDHRALVEAAKKDYRDSAVFGPPDRETRA